MFKLTKPEMALMGITILWGCTFVLIHEAMRYSEPLFFVAVRFTASGLLGLVIFRNSMRGLTTFELKAGVCIGAAIFVGYSLITYGLKFISASQSAFITAMYVPLVPIMQWLLMRNPPSHMAWIGVLFAFAGLVFVTAPDSIEVFHFGVGEAMTLFGAITIAVEIILIGYFAPKANIKRITVIQLLTAGGIAFSLMPIVGGQVPTFGSKIIVIPLAIGAITIIIQLTMNWAQQTVSPTRATLIYASEPIWAGLVSYLVGENIGWFAIVGVLLIIFGMVISDLPSKFTMSFLGAKDDPVKRTTD